MKQYNSQKIKKTRKSQGRGWWQSKLWYNKEVKDKKHDTIGYVTIVKRRIRKTTDYLSALKVEGLQPSPSPLFPFMVASPLGMNFHLVIIPCPLSHVPPIPPSFYSHSPWTSPPLMHPSSAFPGPITKISPFPLPCFLIPSPTFSGPLSPPSPLFSSNCPFLSLHHPLFTVISVLCVAVICVMYSSSVS